MSFDNYTAKELSGIRNYFIPDMLVDTLKLDFDYPILIVGKEGVGKSTLAILLADLIIKTRNKIEGTNDKLEIDKITYYSLDKLKKDVFASGRPGDVKLIDEGAITGAYTREAMSKENRNLNKTLMTCRSRNQILLILVPDINAVDRHVRERAKTVIRVVNRGHAWVYHESEKNICIKWNPRFNKLQFKQRPHFHLEKYRDVKTILGEKIWNDYIRHKEDSLRGDEPESESSDIPVNYISPKIVMERYSIGRDKLLNLRKEGKIKYLFAGNKYIYDENSIIDYFRQETTKTGSFSTIGSEYGRKESEK
jgi:energy-coupling factor transporter ATP-binding protein EcfA2